MITVIVLLSILIVVIVYFGSIITWQLKTLINNNLVVALNSTENLKKLFKDKIVQK